MIPPDWEHSGGIKIKRAEKHIRDLEAEVDAFENRRPCGVWSDQDQQSGALIIRARVTELPDVGWGAIAGDAIHNLRSALDVLWRMAMYPTSSITDERRSGFVIHRSPKAFEAGNSRVIGSSRKAAVELYRRLKPYKGGNDSLWRLHRLNIADKHHVLLPVVVAVQNTRSKWEVRYSQKVDWRSLIPLTMPDEPRIIYAVEDGAELKRFVPRFPDVPAQMDVEADFTFHVALGQREIAEAEPIVDALNHFVGVVKDIAKQFIAAGVIT